MPFSTVSSLAALRSVSGMRLVLSFRQQNLPPRHREYWGTDGTATCRRSRVLKDLHFEQNYKTHRRAATINKSRTPCVPQPQSHTSASPPIARLHSARLPFAVLAPRTLARNPSRTRPQCFFDFFCGKAFPTHGKTNPKSTAGTSTFSPASLPPLPA